MKELKQFLEDLCKAFNLDLKDAVSQSRKKELVFIRHMFFHTAVVNFQRKEIFSYESIGEIANRNHSTVIHSHKTWELEKEQHAYHNEKLEKLKAKYNFK